MRKILTISALILLLGGCWNGTAISLGDASLGQQLIDLKRALDEGAINEEEFEQTKADLLDLVKHCDTFNWDC